MAHCEERIYHVLSVPGVQLPAQPSAMLVASPGLEADCVVGSFNVGDGSGSGTCGRVISGHRSQCVCQFIKPAAPQPPEAIGRPRKSCPSSLPAAVRVRHGVVDAAVQSEPSAAVLHVLVVVGQQSLDGLSAPEPANTSPSPRAAALVVPLHHDAHQALVVHHRGLDDKEAALRDGVS